jgi:hypothetical protein
VLALRAERAHVVARHCERVSNRTATAAERAERDAFDRAHAHEQPPDESKWQPQSIVVEGLPVLFQSLRVEHAAVAQAVVGVLVVAIRARRWDLENLVLVEVDDFSEYERGSAEMRRRLGF